ncbi:MAG: rhodanese-like domain-containing protein [Desulfobulbaceae bacterium]|nr:rhodanese-like domain-containing protein [Desulfobulbaceae bacterium]
MRNGISKLLGVGVCALLLAGVCLSTQAFAEAKDPMQFVAAAKAQITEVSPQAVKADLDAGKAIVLLDVRDSVEFDAGHLPKAVNISRGLLEFKVGGMLPDKNANIVVYCRTDARSALATAVMQEMGYTNVKNMLGSFKAWGLAGYPIYNRHGEFTMVSFEKKE